MRLLRVSVACVALGCGFVAAQTPVAPSPAASVAWPGAETPLGAQITAMVNEPAVSRAHWGVAVTAMDGTPIVGLNQGQVFRPASNTKLFTSATAVAALGETKTFETRIYGDLHAGAVQGNLMLVGGGDANFDSGDIPYIQPSQRPKNQPYISRGLPELAAMADQVASHGVKRVTGDIVGDDTLYPWEPYGDSWSWDDLVWGYGAPVSALTISDNQLRMAINPTKPGEPATVEFDQYGVPYFTIEGHVTTVAAKTKGVSAQIERLPGSHVLRLYGEIAADARPDVEDIAIDDPALFAAMALKQMLVTRGIAVTGEARAKHRAAMDDQGFVTQLHAVANGPCDAVLFGEHPNCATPMCVARPATQGIVLASHTSPTLRDDEMFTLKVSQNLHAEILLHNAGAAFACGGDGSTLQGAKVVRAFLARAGVDVNDFLLYDGSGMSGHNLVAPRATAQLLRYAATQPWFADWKISLPVGGEDGTLANRFGKPPLKDHLFAKTGTLGQTRALSGYLDTASGKTVIFSIMVDTHLPGSADQAVMDRIVAAIAAAN